MGWGMARVPMISTVTAAAVVRFIEERGGPADRIVADAGLARSRFADPKAQIPFVRHVALIEAAASHMGDELFGIRFGNTIDPSSGGLYLYILFNSPTLGASIDNIGRYMYIHNEGTAVETFEEGDLFGLRYHITDRRAVGSTQQIGVAFAAFLRFARVQTGLRLTPERVEVVHAPHKDPSEAQRLLGAPISYHMPRNAILFPRSWLDLPVGSADTNLLSILTDYGDQVLSERRRGLDIVDQVEDWIVKRLPTGRVDIESAARDFGMSGRTLSRRLADNKTTFSQLVEDLRAQLAQRYVGDPSLSLTSIAYLLGYADPTSFSKAFKNRYGSPPQRYRTERTGAAA
jgi:AraC-like DNA-binding protein